MTSQKTLLRITIGLAVVLLLVVGYAIVNRNPGDAPTPGAAGNLLAEDYVNYVSNNSGYNSAKDITTSGTLTGGTLAVTGNQTVTGTATFTATTTQSSVYSSRGGIDYADLQVSIDTASSTLCSPINPWGLLASSTPLAFALNVTTATSVSPAFDMSTTTNTGATTTTAWLRNVPLAANAEVYFWTPGLSTSTPGAGIIKESDPHSGLSVFRIGQTERLIVKAGGYPGVAVGGTGIVGTCSWLLMKP